MVEVDMCINVLVVLENHNGNVSLLDAVLHFLRTLLNLDDLVFQDFSTRLCETIVSILPEPHHENFNLVCSPFCCIGDIVCLYK